MNRNIIYIVFISLVVILLTGCEEKMNGEFLADSQIYFDRSEGAGVCDSLVYSFAVYNEDLNRAQINIPIITTGDVRDYDREIKIDVKDTSSFDKNYEIVNPIMLANKTKCFLTVNIRKTSELKEKARVLDFILISNKHFKTSMDTLWWDYKVKFNDILTKPNKWIYDFQPYFGVYSKVKYKFIIKITGKIDFPSKGENSVSKGMMLYYKDKCKTALARYKRENGPLMDEKDREINF